MKKTLLLTSAIAASTLSLQAANVYTLDLSTQSENEDAQGHFLGGTGAANATAIGYDAVFASASSTVDITNGVGALGTIDFLFEANDPRFRGAGVWVDSSLWGAGLVTITFDVTNFALANDGTSFFQAYSQIGAVDAVTDGISIDLHAADSPVIEIFGDAALTTITGTTAITGNGTGLSFSFVSDGTAEGVALTWNSFSDGGSGTEVFSVSNVAIDVSAVPEPGAYALLAGLTGLAFVVVRRRRA